MIDLERLRAAHSQAASGGDYEGGKLAVERALSDLPHNEMGAWLKGEVVPTLSSFFQDIGDSDEEIEMALIGVFMAGFTTGRILEQALPQETTQ